MLDPVDIEAEFGADADPTVVDAEIRRRMQEALDELGAAAPVPGPGLIGMSKLAGLRTQLWVFSVLVRSRMLTLMRPDKYVGLVRVLRAQGTNATTSFSLAAIRRPHGTAIVDERGSLTWRELQQRADALAVGLVELAGSTPETVAILCRNHRGIVDALIANSRLGGQALLLNTGFSGPQLADVMVREGATIIVYDEEFAGVVTEARDRIDGLVEVLGWVDDLDVAHAHPTIDELITRHAGQKVVPRAGSKVVLLTSGTTGTPKGARRGGGGADELAGMLERIPWRGEDTVVVAAPMFHAWGFGQLVVGATMTCTIVMRRRFDPEATLALVDEHQAGGLGVVPVMLERIVDLPSEVLDRYSLSSLRFVSASGSRMRPDAVVAFMDRFGDVVHNSYNATEAGQISVAGPADLRHAADTAGRAVRGTLLRVVDDEGRDVPVGEVGRIVVHGASPFDGYTSGATQGLPRRLHGLRRRGPSRRRRSPLRGGPRRRHDRVGRRERVPDRGGEDARSAPGRARGRRDRRRRRGVRTAARGVRRRGARHIADRRPAARPREGRVWPATRCRATWCCSTSCHATPPAR